MAFTVKELLKGGLPDFLDLGGNAEGSGNASQFTERQPPTNTAGQGVIAPQPVNWPMWIAVAAVAVVALGVILKK